MKNYKFRIDVWAVLLFAVIMLPNIISVIMSLAIAPCLTFMSFSFGKKNWLALILCAIFLICHLIFAICNFCWFCIWKAPFSIHLLRSSSDLPAAVILDTKKDICKDYFRCNASCPYGSGGPMDVYITQPESGKAFFTLMER